MKLAYIGYDLNSLKSITALSRYFDEVEFFLVEPMREVFDFNFELIPLLADTHCIPPDDALKTGAHVDTFKKIRAQYHQFRHELFNHLKIRMAPAVQSLQPKNLTASGIKKSQFSEIQDVFFDAKKQKVYVEKKQAGIDEYDFIIVEDHQLVSETVAAMTKNILSGKAQNSHIWFSSQFEYELKMPRSGVLNSKNFLIVKDSLNESLIDNWYFCYLHHSKLTVQQWVPYNQHQNLDYRKFMIERTRAALMQKFEFIHLKESGEASVHTTSGFFKNRVSLKNNRLSAAVPSFEFWPPDRIEGFLVQTLAIKIKKLLKPETTRGMN